MASQTIARLFDTYADASAAIRDLEAAGFSHDDVSLVAGGSTATDADDTDGDSASGAGTGATVGTLLGGGAGLLAGIGALAIPGIGPIVAAGWLVAALTGAGVGAAAGGLLGGLTQAGIGEEHAQVYTEGVKRGGNLVTVRTDESRAAEVESIMRRHNAADTEERASSYRSGGWTGSTDNSGTSAGLAAGAGAATMGMAHDRGFGSAPDGTPGNPPGTMASRGLDQVAGTNVSGANPGGTGPRNEASMHLGGAVGGPGMTGSGVGTLGTGAGTVGMTSSAPDGTPGNPPGTATGRAVDRATGTNTPSTTPGTTPAPAR